MLNVGKSVAAGHGPMLKGLVFAARRQRAMLPQSEASPSSNTSTFRVAGIGASAGGLEAVLDLLRALPSNTGMAFVLIQHLEPHYKSQLAEILSRSAKIPMVTAEEGMQVEPDHMYV